MDRQTLIRVLVVEDNPVEATLITSILLDVSAPRVQVDSAATLAAATALLSGHPWDAVLLDLNLPDSEGIDTFREVKKVVPALPVVVLTGMDDEALAWQALREGAQDYLFKGQVDSQLVLRSLHYAIERQCTRVEQELRASRLGRCLDLLHEGFSQLAAGNFEVRLAARHPLGPGDDGLPEVLDGFDRTVGQLQAFRDMKARFSSMVTHDLRSPLNTILMAVCALESTTESVENCRKYCDIIHRKSSFLLQLVAELQEILSAEALRVELQVAESDLNQMLESCVEGLRSQARQRGQTLVLERSDGPLPVVCDPAKISRVVENLVGNAIKYSVEGDTICIRACEQTPARVCVEVIDHGPGIAAEDREKVFELFYRGNGPQRTGVWGKGLGLGICRAFVQAHGGCIRVLGDPAPGARIAFELPRRCETGRAVVTLDEPAQDPAAAPSMR
ncbi:MAG: response regulator [Candidatus Riflebacteria bacterium]|nr:response regulator [Candidatus Riflebacteria bacterium]